MMEKESSETFGQILKEKLSANLDDNRAQQVENFRQQLTPKKREENLAIWRDNFQSKPESFFDVESLEKLEKMSPEKRLSVFGLVAVDKKITPGMAKRYFQKFPGDLQILIGSYEKHGFDTQEEFFILSLVAPLIVREKPELRHRLRQFLEIAERREQMQNVLLEDEVREDEKEKAFGEAWQDFREVFYQAVEINFSKQGELDLSKLFANNFEQLSPAIKEKFLRQCVVDLHNELVMNEAIQSPFTKKMIDRNNRIFRAASQKQAPHLPHSMIFKSYQPSAAYETSQKDFDRRMKHSAWSGGYKEEFPFHKILLKTLRQFDTHNQDADRNTDLLVEFWDKNRNPIFANYLVEALENQDVGRAVARLLQSLQENQAEHRNAIASILFRLEVGRIGISEQGVQYLTKLFDLKELNNPDFFVYRLTAGGDIGVFDQDGTLQNHFKVTPDDLLSEEKIIHPEVLDFTVESLFYAQTDETEEEKARREEILAEFKEKYFELYIQEFREQTGVRFNDFELKEQGQFLHYYNGATSQQKEKLMSFVKRYKENGLKTFLSLERGGAEMGRKILAIGEKFENDPIVAEMIFAKYAELVQAADSLEEYLQKQFTDSSSEEVIKIREGLLEKAKQQLEFFADNEMSADELMKELKLIKAGNHILAERVKILRKEGLIGNIKDLEKVSFRGISGEEVLNNETVLSRLRELYETNYLHYSEEGRNELLSKFENRLKGKNTKVYTLSFDKEIISFVVIEEDAENKEIYLSGFNVDKYLKDITAGKVVFEDVLNIYEQRKWSVKLEASPDSARCYINNYGFYAYERVEDPDEDYILNLKKDARRRFQSAKYDYDRIREMAQRSAAGNDKVVAWMTTDKTKTPPQLQKGYVITRAFKSARSGELRYYFLLEKI